MFLQCCLNNYSVTLNAVYTLQEQPRNPFQLILLDFKCLQAVNYLRQEYFRGPELFTVILMFRLKEQNIIFPSFLKVLHLVG